MLTTAKNINLTFSVHFVQVKILCSILDKETFRTQNLPSTLNIEKKTVQKVLGHHNLAN